MRPLRSILALCACAFAGCVDGTRIELSFPPGIELYAVVERIDAGRAVRATGLLPPSNAVAISRSTRGSTWIVGYSRSALSALGVDVPDGEALAREPLTSPRPCERPLPAPSWVRTLDESGQAVLASEDVPLLTASWLNASCPAVATDDWVIGLDCQMNWCDAKATVDEYGFLWIDLA